MKLELRRLAPYLPYKLKVTFEADEYQHEMVGLCICSQGVDIISPYGDFGKANAEDVIPILRPLSDLDNHLRNEFEKLDRGYAYDKIAVDLFCEENGVDEYIENIDLKSLPYECVEYMFEHHYDVFSLIDQDLAIDINTLKE